MSASKWAVFAAALAFAGAAVAQDGAKEASKEASKEGSKEVTISSPADGAKIPGNSTKLVFDVASTPKAEHVHIYVDGEQVAQLHQLKGSYQVDKLSAGKHWLCVRVVDKGHTPVGLEKCVGVTIGNVPPMGY
jgi:ABC-type enterochelin transport system substrate-binding protein